MTKQEIYDYLKEKGLHFEVTEHRPVFSMNDLAGVELPYPEADAKNLFLRDNKKKNFYLITVAGEKKVDLKAFRKKYATKPLSFADDTLLKEILDLTPGSVTPLGLINDKEHKVNYYIDKELVDLGMVAAHPCENTATVWLRTNELIDLIRSFGNPVEILDINKLNEPKDSL